MSDAARPVPPRSSVSAAGFPWQHDPSGDRAPAEVVATDCGPPDCVLWHRDHPAPVVDLRSAAAASPLPVSCLAHRGTLINRRQIAERYDAPQGGGVDRLLALAWSADGEACLEHLRGNLAFVLWRRDPAGLLVVADRLGVHRYAYAFHGRRVAVDASPSRLLAALGKPAEADRAALLAHLAGAPPPAGSTHWAGVHRVEAGGLLRIGRDDVLGKTWWHLSPPDRLVPPAEAPAVVADALDAVVPEVWNAGLRPAAGEGRGEVAAGGLLLSSGLDSGSVAAALATAARERGGPLPHALTWSFGDVPEADEEEPARQVARHLGLPHHVFPGGPHAPLSATGGTAPTWLGAAADPGAGHATVLGPGTVAGPADAPSVMAYRELLDEACRRTHFLGLRRLATGAGGDLLFGYCGPGSYGYPDLLLTGRWWSLGRQLGRHLRATSAPTRRVLDLELLRPLARPWARRLRPRDWWLPGFLATDRREEAQAAVGRPEGDARRGQRPAHTYRLRALAGLRWQGRVLDEVQELARGRGVEAVFPLVDHRLWETSAALAPEAHFEAGLHKAALRRALAGRLPDAALRRRHKIQPGAVFGRALRHHADHVRPLLRNSRLADLGLVDASRLEGSFEAFLDGTGGEGFWPAVTAETWLRRFP